DPAVGEEIGLAVGLRGGGSGPEPADQEEIVVVPGPERIVVEAEWEPDAGLRFRESELARHDADHPAGNPVEPDLAGQDLRIGAEPGAPDRFADDDHRRGGLARLP